MKSICIIIFFIFFTSHIRAQDGATSINSAVIINEDFNNNSNRWYEDSTSSYELHVRYGQYALINRDSSGRIFVHTFLQDFEKDDYKIEVSVKHGLGIDDKGVGIVFGADMMLKNYYRFLFSNNGSFLVQAMLETKTNTLQDWKYSDNIKKDDYNKLTIVKFGNHWTFRINDAIVYSADALPFFGNRHGYYVASKSGITSNLFKISNLTVQQNDPNAEKENIYETVFHDEFISNNNDWDISSNDDQITQIDDGFTVQNKTEGHYISWQTMPISDVMNHRIEIKVKHTGGVEDYPYGICFGTKDADNTYFFAISANGSFLIGSFADGEYHTVNAWTESDAIYTNYGATNTLAIEKSDKWDFYINGKLVHTCDMKTYFGNKFGVYIENKQTVNFKSIKLAQVTMF